MRDWILPELAGRLLTLVRSPAVGKKTFYQKHIGDEAPPAIKRFNLDGREEPEIYPYIDDLPGLIGLVQMGVLEIHPWGSRVDKLELPDRVTIDLDPERPALGARHRSRYGRARRARRDWLEELCQDDRRQGPACGYPADAQARLGPGQGVRQWIADSFVAQRPDDFTANMAKGARHGRIYIDYLRNGRGATAVGAYIPRARPSAPVSTPLFWEEVEQGVRPRRVHGRDRPEAAHVAALRSLGGNRQNPPNDKRRGATAVGI